MAQPPAGTMTTPSGDDVQKHRSLVISFYGFKGGAGRTLAAAHMAYFYAKSGKRVLLVDADLEAPGLSFWNEPLPAQADHGLAQCLVDLADDTIDSTSSVTLRPYILTKPDFFASERAADPNQFVGSFGEVHLLPAGLGSTNESLDEYIATLPKAHEAVSHIGKKLRKALELSGYDIVLVDSRPGLHRIGAALFDELADLNVVLFGPTRQGFQGLLTSLEMFSAEQLGRVVFVLSPVPWGGAKRLNDAQKAIRAKSDSANVPPRHVLTVNWHPVLAIDDRLIPIADPTSTTSRDYQKLFVELEDLRGFGIDRFTGSVDALLDIFKAAIAVEEEESYGHLHFSQTLKSELPTAFPEAPPTYLTAISNYVATLHDHWGLWRRREPIILLLVWEIIRRLQKLAELDQYASEALWAIVVRRNYSGSHSMYERYEALYELDEAARRNLPRIVDLLYTEYIKQFQDTLHGVTLSATCSNTGTSPSPPLTLDSFVAMTGGL